MLKKEQEIESRKSGMVFRVNFTDGEQKYKFRIGSSDNFANMVYGDRKFQECPLWWFPDTQKFAIQSPEGKYSVDYSQIEDGIICVSINDIHDKILKITEIDL